MPRGAVFYHPLSRWYDSAAEGGFVLVAVVMNGQVQDRSLQAGRMSGLVAAWSKSIVAKLSLGNWSCHAIRFPTGTAV